MCTLIVGRDLPEAGSMWIAANRDEAPLRPSDPPAVLLDRPRVVGGRDRVAGGTWLAIHERRAVIAMLNRRASGPGAESGVPDGAAPGSGAAAALRSRGLLALDAAAAIETGGGLARAIRDQALRALGAARYAPFSMVFAAPEGGWALVHDPDAAPRVLDLAPGWHVITHAEIDDPVEPRTAFLLRGLRSWRPRSLEEIERGLIERLRSHAASDAPAVCIHEGRMITVSSSLVHLSPSDARYLHAEGPPCRHPHQDRSALLEGAAAASESA